MCRQRPDASRCFLGISIVLFLFIAFSYKFNDIFNSYEKRFKQERFMMEMKMVKLEIEKEWEKMKNGLPNTRGKLQWHKDALKRVGEFNEAVKNINALTEQQITDQRSLWGGRNPVEVLNKWPGIALNGDLPLRFFIGIDELDFSKKKNQMSNIAVEERFHQLMNQIHVHCFLQKRFGYYKDGGWDMCLSDPYRPKKDNCLVYSFGINNDFSFDDDIDKTYGCKVNSYDPSMSVKSHNRSENIRFYKIGLGGKDAIGKKKWQLKTFSTILKENGHSDTIIDYLKMDIESSEIPSLKQMIAAQSLKNVKQLSFELHLYERTSNHLFSYYALLHHLEKLGFRRYFYHINPHCVEKSEVSGLKRSICHEFYYININFL